jgi:protoporphyrinogen oxidase
MSSDKIAVIIGAGPAGLTAALELLRQTSVKPIVFEASSEVGGISRTVNHRGNRMDIGGHRFFSKSDWVMNWWLGVLPLDSTAADQGDIQISYQNRQREFNVRHSPTTDDPSQVMLVRRRLSRIYYLRKFFDYPVKLNLQTISNLGVVCMSLAGLSYLYARLFPRTPERTLEDFLINRFGHRLYLTFFKSYTEKVWGVPCDQISAEWGAQRIKGLSIRKVISHALRKVLPQRTQRDLRNTQTSLIERFFYPCQGPGQLWQVVAEQVIQMGGKIHMEHTVTGLVRDRNRIKIVRVKNNTTGRETDVVCDYVLSTMPVKELILAMEPPVPDPVRDVAATLPYRDFITVGLLVKRMLPNPQSKSIASNNMPPDNWIYIQEPDVKLGRLQIFNNWSPGMVRDREQIWIGLEYFCYEGDELWSMSDEAMVEFAAKELAKINLIATTDVLDSRVIRVPKAYPAYYGSYACFDLINIFVDDYNNLFLIGRNGMHRYNNQDHSMLTAKMAVDNIACGRDDKENIWAVNIDDDYHEEKLDKPQAREENDIPPQPAYESSNLR